MKEKLIELIYKFVSMQILSVNKIGRKPKVTAEMTVNALASFLIENGVLIADDVVSKELYEQIKWERDVALKQLERIGVSLGEKTDNIVSVVRCGECAYAKKLLVFENFYSCLTNETFVSENDYCSYGEPKESEE